MSNDENTELKKDQQSYDSITQKDNISNTNDNTISQNIKLSSEEESNTNSILKDVIYNRFIQFKDWISKKFLQLSEKIKIESSYKSFLIFLIVGIIFLIMSLFNLPFILLKPVQFYDFICIITYFWYYIFNKTKIFFFFIFFNWPNDYCNNVFLNIYSWRTKWN